VGRAWPCRRGAARPGRGARPAAVRGRGTRTGTVPARGRRGGGRLGRQARHHAGPRLDGRPQPHVGRRQPRRRRAGPRRRTRPLRREVLSPGGMTPPGPPSMGGHRPRSAPRRGTTPLHPPAWEDVVPAVLLAGDDPPAPPGMGGRRPPIAPYGGLAKTARPRAVVAVKAQWLL